MNEALKVALKAEPIRSGRSYYTIYIHIYLVLNP
jgi:hypothetical protein